MRGRIKGVKFNEKEIDQAIKRAIARIPLEIRRHLKNIVISVQKRPSREIREEMGLHRNEDLFGLYRGISLMDRSTFHPPLYPDTIILFQEPLERMCNTIDELEAQIEITVVHEVAHFLGMSEERLAELGYN